MKFNKTRFVVTTLAICSAGALLGSISSTIAWYQFSTRVSAVFLGASTGEQSNLRLRIKGTDNWNNDLTYHDVNDYLASVDKGQQITPITSGFMDADSAIKTDDSGEKVFYQNPTEEDVERVEYTSPSWRRADDSMYVSIPLELSYIQKTDEGNKFLEKDVYISNLLIQEDYRNRNNSKKDLSESIRVHISAYGSNDKQNTELNKLISKNGGTILTEGHLDIGGDGDLDEYIEGHHGPDYGFIDEDNIERYYVTYGEGVQTAYSNQYDVQDNSYKTLDGQTVNEKVYPTVVKSIGESTVLDEDSFEYQKEGETTKTSKCIGKTVAFEGEQNEAYLNVIMTIWVEGWQPFPSPTNTDPDAKSPIWNASDYIGSMFDVGIEFAVQQD